MWKSAFDQYRFAPSAAQFISAIMGVIAFVCLGFLFRRSRIGSSRFALWQPGKIGWRVLVILLVFVFIDFFAPAGKPASYAVITLLAAAAAMFWLFKYQIYHPQATVAHVVSAVTWPIGFWLVLSIFMEFKMIPNPDNTRGMSIAGLLATLALIVWRKKVLSRNSINNEVNL